MKSETSKPYIETSSVMRDLQSDDGGRTCYALMFAGQGSDTWRNTLDEACADNDVRQFVEDLESQSEKLLAPIATDLMTVCAEQPQDKEVAADAAVSVPGIVRAQAAQLAYFDKVTSPLLDVHRPEAILGHSQGVIAARLAASYLSHDYCGAARYYALARIIGAAASLHARSLGVTIAEERTTMLSVKGMPVERIQRIVSGILGHDLLPAVINGFDHVVFSGMPVTMARLAAGMDEAVKRQEKERAMRGGPALKITKEFLAVNVPFHSSLMDPAVEQTVLWATRCGFDEQETRQLAEHILTKTEHWDERVDNALEQHNIRWFVDLGPGNLLGDLTNAVLEGSGAGVIAAGTPQSCDELTVPDHRVAPTEDWSAYAPQLLSLPDGRIVLDTAFTRLTGRSAIMLGGMTPTTVDPAIVAAAANAGHWAELAGGGQVTKDIFFSNMKKLHELLAPGVAVQFNTMMMNPTLWNLHFGTKNTVGKARLAGAPLDGVTLSAGLPEADKAEALFSHLHKEGFPYVALKVGSVAQIRQAVAIAKDNPETSLILQVEDGRGGGHHSWESLDDMLIAQYANIRNRSNIVLAVGGGFGTPEKAARYITGAWSTAYGLRPMPVDAVFIGTAAMTCKEALTNPDVKQALVDASGIEETDVWIPRNGVRGGVASSISALHADLYELDNAASRCNRLLTEITGAKDIIKAVEKRRDEIIAALNTTAKPYFGDVTKMTYSEWLHRYVQLSYPWADSTIGQRFARMVERCQQRFVAQDHGEFRPLIDARQANDDPDAAIGQVEREYPQSSCVTVTQTDAAWFIDLCGAAGKPVPFVPVVDEEVAHWWGQDAMWQSQDSRYKADQVLALPGPVSVAHVDRVNEPVGELLGRFEQGCVDALVKNGVEPARAVARRADPATGKAVTDAERFIRSSALEFRYGHLTGNAGADVNNADGHITYEPVPGHRDTWQVITHFDNTYWDDRDGGDSAYTVRECKTPLAMPASAANGGYPITDDDLLEEDMKEFLNAVAGVGTEDVCGNAIDALPECRPSERSPFGEFHWRFHVDNALGAKHFATSVGRLPGYLEPARIVPDALMCMLWPALYAGESSGRTNGVSWLESLQVSVHLTHSVRFSSGMTISSIMDRYQAITDDGGKPYLEVIGWADPAIESVSGRVITAHMALYLGDEGDGEMNAVAEFTERFIVPTYVYADVPAQDAEPYGGALAAADETEIGAKRRTLRRFHVTAPADMMAFERVSGDYNPLHVSRVSARMAGYDRPIVNGMWLSAVAQQAVESVNTLDGSRFHIEGWTYSMFAPVSLGADVQVAVERIGRASNGRILLEVVCKSGDETVSRARVLAKGAKSAYVFPGQGSQRKGMGMDDIATSAAAREIWNRADAHTRKAHGFSILSIVRDNPSSIVVKGVEYKHPKGVLYLSQFTQVALTVLGFAQFAKFTENEAMVMDDSYLAGHSLGEYTALSVVGNVLSLETVIDMVYQRGNTMYELVDRDENGRSNYGMGALRPVQFGVNDDQVNEYVEKISQECGEFLQIVNYNVAGSQYAVVGTIKGLRYLQADAERRAKEYGGKPPYMPIPGIDVPFHSRLMRPGVPKYRTKLEALIPEDQDCRGLVGRYIPNLVARPFALTRDFAESILEVAPSEKLEEALASKDSWQWWEEHPQKLSRMLLVELLAWQFASPVRWIETQRLLFTPRNRGGIGVEQFVEVGLASAPVLANMAAKTLRQSEFADAHVQVLNIGRDGARILGEDTDPAPGVEQEIVEDENLAETATMPEHAAAPSSPVASVAPAATAAASVASGPAPELAFTASDAVGVILAQENKIRLDQIGTADTLETLTNGVSSKRNQQLVDIAAEIAVPSLEGAAEASMDKLTGMVNAAAGGYQPFGSVLDESVKSHIHNLFSAARVPQVHVADRLKQHWNLDGGWVNWTLVELMLGSREGTSLRGGDLRTLKVGSVKTVSDVDSLIDEAVQAVAKVHGIAITPVSTGSASSGVVDSAALKAYEAKVTGPDGVLAATARDVLRRLGLAHDADDVADADAESNAKVVALVEKELGADWAKSVTPVFDADKAVLFDDRWASAREDLVRMNEHGSLDEDPLFGDTPSFLGLGDTIAAQANWWAEKCNREGKTELAAQYRAIAHDASADDQRIADELLFDGKVALITGATPRSIAGALVARFLAGGATVIMTASHIDWKRLRFARDVYRRHASGHAQLWLVPANLSSYQDIDSLIAWTTTEQKRSVGADSILLKPALMPDFFIPFAAPRVSGTLDQVGPAAEKQMRLLLWSVERGIADLAHAREDVDVSHRTMVILPGSGNRGVFGGDGAYGEAKNAFDAIERKWKSEPGWHDRILLAQPTIGWVRGTGLMSQNDPLVEAVEAKGVRTYSTEEIAEELMKLCMPESVAQAMQSPIHANLTGGVGEVDVDMAAIGSELIAEYRKRSRAKNTHSQKTQDRMLKALPAPATAAAGIRNASDTIADAKRWGMVRDDLDDMVVVVGTGVLGPWGSSRTAAEAELGIKFDGTAEMTANGVIELAWSMGLITWQDKPESGWKDAKTGEVLDEADVYERYHDEVVARCGVRELVDDGEIIPGNNEIQPVVYLDKDISFDVPERSVAEDYKACDPEHTAIHENIETGEWTVIRKAGSKIRVPRRRAVLRNVGAQIPDGFDPGRWGLPSSMLESLDRVALWSMITAVDAFLASGFTPAEILQTIHPADFASTQSTGIGGQHAQSQMFEQYELGGQLPPDLFAEVMPNIVGGHVMQSYLGGYGEINTPIGACATAAVSLEEGVDKIRLNKADFVVTGGVDDISRASVFGFGNMHATADDTTMKTEGIATRFMSRPDDRRRAGFVESQGGGTVLIARASLALRLGLPVLGVVGYARTFADGAHTSIPAPGMGALAAGRGGKHSALVRQLSDLGLTADDITVVCKHDTSTMANDTNESEIHRRLAHAIGRSEGNPLYVYSPKAFTGHAKGGSFAFQTADIMHMFQKNIVPANMSLDCVDPAMRQDDELVWVRNKPLDLGSMGIPVKSVIATSLGFGHVSTVVVFVNPIAFAAAVIASGTTEKDGLEVLRQWIERSNRRLADGARRLDAGLHGHAPLYEPIEERHFHEGSGAKAPHEVEARMLLDAEARLGVDGYYR